MGLIRSIKFLKMLMNKGETRSYIKFEFSECGDNNNWILTQFSLVGLATKFNDYFASNSTVAQANETDNYLLRDFDDDIENVKKTHAYIL